MAMDLGLRRAKNWAADEVGSSLSSSLPYSTLLEAEVARAVVEVQKARS